MLRTRLLAGSVVVACLCCSSARQEVLISDGNPLAMPPVGAHQLRVLSPDLLELTLITTKKRDPATATIWNFADSNGKAHLPAENQFSVQVDGKNDAVKSVGFKRRVLYAPLKE